jgi:hypothetical protein
MINLEKAEKSMQAFGGTHLGSLSPHLASVWISSSPLV